MTAQPLPEKDAKQTPCCADHDDCHLPGEMICCERCPDMDRCDCGHGWHLHDAEAVSALCVPCGDGESCVLPGGASDD